MAFQSNAKLNKICKAYEKGESLEGTVSQDFEGLLKSLSYSSKGFTPTSSY
jgi:hypothetical protein